MHYIMEQKKYLNRYLDGSVFYKACKTPMTDNSSNLIDRRIQFGGNMHESPTELTI